MSWWSRKKQAWTLAAEAAETERWVARLKETADAEIGAMLAVATDWRNRCRDKTGVDLLKPAECVAETPGIFGELAGLVREAQRAKRPELAAAIVIWLYTCRGATGERHRDNALAMWRELARGMAHVPACAAGLETALKQTLDIDGHDRFPKGFDPRIA